MEMVAAALPRTQAPRRIEVDPSIEEVIGSASKPSGVPAAVAPPEAIPGKVGLFAGVQTLFGSMRRGAEYIEEQRARYGDLHRGTFLDRDMVFIWEADEIHKALRNEGGAWSTGMGWDVLAFQGLEDTQGNSGSLLALDFEDHRAARALVQPAFTMRAVQGYLETARLAFDEAIPVWIEDAFRSSATSARYSRASRTRSSRASKTRRRSPRSIARSSTSGPACSRSRADHGCHRSSAARVAATQRCARRS
jgi:hypothetical protein